MTASQSVKRQQRGAAARILLSLHEADQLAHSELWTWEVLDALPTWCLEDESTRTSKQLLCGALVLAPQLRFWIDRKLILVAHELIGKDYFNHIVLKADQTPIAINASASSRFKSALDDTDLKGSVRTIFMQAGASVLKATLSHDLLNELFSGVLGETAGDITEKLATDLLIQAQCMQEEIESNVSIASARDSANAGAKASANANFSANSNSNASANSNANASTAEQANIEMVQA